MNTIEIKEITHVIEVDDNHIEVVTIGTQGPPGAGGGNSILKTEQIMIDFGNASGGESGFATASVDAAWVTSNSIIICNAAGVATQDHDAEDAAMEGITALAANLNEGVGFDVIARAAVGSWGRYIINIIGV